MNQILLISTGGTIASTDKGEGLSPSLKGQELLSFITIPSDVHVDVFPLSNVDSTNVTPQLWERICLLIKDNWDKYSGFVVTHGTDTMAYTAAALYFMIENPNKPIIITGSQLPLGHRGGDGEKNLSDSVSAACSTKNGVFGLFGGKLISAKFLRKTHTENFDGFSCVNENSKAKADNIPVKFHTSINSKINIFFFTPSSSPPLLRLMGTNSDGIIIMGFGAGGVPTYTDEYLDILKELKAMKKPVVMSTQVISGPTNLSKYAVGRSALNLGVMESGFLTPEATFAALSLALNEGKDYDEIKSVFENLKLK